MVEWKDYVVNDDEIESRSYRRHIGSGQEWKGRGLFQLEFLKWLGMKQNDSVLDFGCGPFRAAEHLIRYLNNRLYCGVDINSDFINVCIRETEVFKLNEKQPEFILLDNFDFCRLSSFKYVMIFSVLNHLSISESKKIMSQLTMNGENRVSSIVITNAWWIDKSFMDFLTGPLGIEKSKIFFYFAEDISLSKNIYKEFGMAPKNFPLTVIKLG